MRTLRTVVLVVEPSRCTYGASAVDAQVELVEAGETVTPLGPVGVRLGGDVDVLATLCVVAREGYAAEETAPVEVTEDVLSVSAGSPKAELWEPLVLRKTVVVFLHGVGDVGVGVVG